MIDANRELEIAMALSTMRDERARGESPNALAYRDRLGKAHGSFVDLLQVDEMIDDFTDPPAPENLPRDFGGYRLEREIGQGAIGVVYQATHKTLGRKAAVKVLRPEYSHDPEARDRFRDEAYTTAQVSHDHIVEIFETGEIGGTLFYAMALVDGNSLASLIASNRVPPIREFCRQLAGIADGLDHLHHADRPIVHRDVKPSNIMVRMSDGRMILCDFGLARATDGMALTRTGVAVGTPLYMSPEQMRADRDVDGRADIYSLGATLYEAIALKPVFAPSTYEIVSRQVLSDERPVSLRKVAPQCPVGVEKIAMKALEKKRTDRCQTAAVMRDRLLLAADGKHDEISDGPVGRVRRTLRLLGTPMGVAAAASAFLAVGAGLWWTNRPARLDVTTLPAGAEVLVGGARFGHTPLSLPLKPGSYDIVVRRDRFVDYSETVEISAGDTERLKLSMSLKDLDDPVARAEVSQALKVDTLGYKFGVNRSGDEPPLAFIFPRGNVRLGDLDAFGFAYELNSSLPGTDGMLEFRVNGKSIFQTAFPEDFHAGPKQLAFPSEARGQLKVGDFVTWGLTFKGKKSANILAKFTVVDVDPTAKLDEIRAWQASSKDPKATAGLAGELEVRALWAVGLMSAALVKADKLAEDHQDSATLQALARLAHRRLRDDDGGTRVRQLTARFESFPKDLQDRLNADEPDAAADAAIPGR